MSVTGTVVRSTGSWSSVRLSSGEMLECRLRGTFRLKGIKSTNPIAVGDIVTVDPDEKETDKGVITFIDDRRNYIIRKSVNLSKRSHIIASNMDQLLVLATVAHPRVSLGFIDRLLVTAEAYEIPAIIVFNKIDILTDEGLGLLAEYRNIYEQVGYRTMMVSAIEKTGLQDLVAEMKNKVSLISGHSGVGKSTLINAIEPDLDLKVNEISDVHLKGKHTTTFAEMFQLSFGGSIIDTPGIKEFGMVNMDDDNVGHYFPEIFKLSEHCRFHNCKHQKEPGCEVLSALEDGRLAPSRFNSYLSVLEDIDKN